MKTINVLERVAGVAGVAGAIWVLLALTGCNVSQADPAVVTDCETYSEEYAAFADGNPVVAYNVQQACEAAVSVSGPWSSYQAAQFEADGMGCERQAFVQTPDDRNFFHVVCPSEARPAFISDRHWTAAECDGYAVTKARTDCQFHDCDDNGQATWSLYVALCEASSVAGAFPSSVDASAFADRLETSSACPGVSGEWSPGAIVESMADDTAGPWLVFCPGR